MRGTLFYLAGLTCTEETFPVKAGAQRVAAELGLMLVAPDTSPRGTGIDGADAEWDFGHGAGFYLDATTEPWAADDASALMRRARRPYPRGILVDQGLGDKFLAEQLHPHEFEAACAAAAQPLTLRRHAGCDHGYHFIASVMEDHLRFHAQRLND